MEMDRISKVVRGVLAVATLGAVVAMASGAALAQDSSDNGNGIGAATGGGVPLAPSYQVGNAQGDGNGQ
jgi:hypothetical protein